jgi:hypothetical protein
MMSPKESLDALQLQWQRELDENRATQIALKEREAELNEALGAYQQARPVMFPVEVKDDLGSIPK